jgi:glycosyltransferase involved in cell wall biosynthesis
MQNILFVSNLFPSPLEPQRGLFNAAFVDALQRHVESQGIQVRVLVPVASGLRKRNVSDWQYPLASALQANVRYVAYQHIPYVGRNLAARFCEQSLGSQLGWFQEADLVVGSWLYPDAVAAWHLAQKAGARFVVRLHGTDRFHLRAGGRARVCRACLQAAEHVFVNANSMQDFLVQHGIPSAKAIYNGVNSQRFYPAPEQDREDGLVLWAGNLVGIKNPARAIRVFDAARPFGATRLVIAGQGPQLAALQKQVEQAGLDDCVQFVGSVTPDALADYMRKASALLLTSASEGMPNVVQEALSCGTPVVATNVGDIVRVIQNGKNGYCCDVGADDELIQGLKQVLQVHWDTMQVRDVSCIRDWEDSAKAFMQAVEGRET